MQISKRVIASLILAVVIGGGSTIEPYLIDSGDDGVILGMVAYPDGSAIDVTLDGNEITFSAILADGTRQMASMTTACEGGIVFAAVQASGRAVHLLAQHDGCGVKHYRYWIPTDMPGLSMYQAFTPLIVNQ